ncbi:MAG: hypothetical protein ACRD6X_20820 [Pyrinomonadaceae bacterium]
MPKFAPKIRVEVYIPIRYETAYRETLLWVTEEFTRLRGGCSVIENSGGYYLSTADQITGDRVNIVYSDFPMNWHDEIDRKNTLVYCSGLQQFLLNNLWEEAILITAYPVNHAVA